MSEHPKTGIMRIIAQLVMEIDPKAPFITDGTYRIPIARRIGDFIDTYVSEKVKEQESLTREFAEGVMRNGIRSIILDDFSQVVHCELCGADAPSVQDLSHFKTCIYAHAEQWLAEHPPRDLSRRRVRDKLPRLIITKCIVCGKDVAWVEDSNLPPACCGHKYQEVFEAFEPAKDTTTSPS